MDEKKKKELRTIFEVGQDFLELCNICPLSKQIGDEEESHVCIYGHLTWGDDREDCLDELLKYFES